MNRSTRKRSTPINKAQNQGKKQPDSKPPTKKQEATPEGRGNRHMQFIFGLSYQVTSTILFAISIASFFFFLSVKKSNYAYWSGFLVLVFAELAIAIYIQQYIYTLAEEKPVSAPQTTTENEKPILEQPTFTEDIKECVFDFGTNIATNRIDVLENHPIQPLTVNGISPVMYIKDRKFYVDVTVSDPDKLLPVQIKEGKLTITPENWDTNSNASAFEVVDEKQDVVFQIIYHKPSKIVLYGVFPDPQVQGQLIYVSEKGIEANFNKPKDFSIKRQFKYPSWKYPGQFDDAEIVKTVSPTPKPKKPQSKSNTIRHRTK